MQSKWILAAVMLLCSGGSASTSTTYQYKGECKYDNAAGQTYFDGQCDINWGIVGPGSCEPGSFLERFILSFPKGKDAVIYIRCDGTGLINDVGAVTIRKPGKVELISTTGEAFFFTDQGDRRCRKDCDRYYLKETPAPSSALNLTTTRVPSVKANRNAD